jgi:hypothetical protein
MEDKKNLFDIDYDGSKTIRILPSNISYGKSFAFKNYVYWSSEEDRKRDLRKKKIKNILNAIDL